MKNLSVRQQRHFSAHGMLLRSASRYLIAAENDERFCFDGDFVCLVMTALAVEALCNTTGELIFPEWKDDYESLSPMQKIRFICRKLDIPYDIESDPFQSIRWLLRFRNKIAHAKPEPLSSEMMMTNEEFDHLQRSDGPQSELEAIVNVQAARRALSAVETLEDLLFDKLPEEERYKLSGIWEMEIIESKDNGRSDGDEGNSTFVTIIEI